MPFETLLPLFVYFLVGIALRAGGILRSEHADTLLRLVFHVTLPALAFLAVSQAELTRESLLLPFIGFSVNLLCLGAAWAYVRAREADSGRAGAILVGTSVTNMIFVFPFVLAALGQAALADAILFDLGNAVFVASVANAVAIRLGHADRFRISDTALRLLRSPLFIALLLAITLNLLDGNVPALISNTLSPLGAATVPLTIIALGLSFRATHLLDAVPVKAVLFRMPLGLLLGIAVVHAFGLEGTMATVVVVSAAAPIGFNAVALASVAKLKTEQVAAAVSLSVLVGMITTSGLLWLMQAA